MKRNGTGVRGARKRTVDAMRRGKYRLLVATDVAARGLDIKGISLARIGHQPCTTCTRDKGYELNVPSQPINQLPQGR